MTDSTGAFRIALRLYGDACADESDSTELRKYDELVEMFERLVKERDALEAALAVSTQAGESMQANLSGLLRERDDARDDLFATGVFTLHSGDTSTLHINCRALRPSELVALAQQAAERLPRFGRVYGIPEGGLRFADALRKHADTSDADLPLVIVDDVCTTGASLEEARRGQNTGRPVIGVVLFARGGCPEWVRPLFSLARSRRGGEG